MLPPETIRQMGEAWNRAQREAEEKGPLLDKNQTLDSVFVAGHVLNLFICVEIVANRRLLYLKEEGTISGDIYKSLDRAGVIPKVLFLFKESLSDDALQVGHLRKLASLRNSAVHYRGNSGAQIATQLKTLLDINREVGKLLSLASDRPTEDELNGMLKSALATHLQ